MEYTYDIEFRQRQLEQFVVDSVTGFKQDEVGTLLPSPSLCRESLTMTVVMVMSILTHSLLSALSIHILLTFHLLLLAFLISLYIIITIVLGGTPSYW